MGQSSSITTLRAPYEGMQLHLVYGPNLRVSDALQLSEGSDVVVAEHGKLVGDVTHAYPCGLGDQYQDGA